MMNDQELLARIAVEHVSRLLAHGVTIGEILEEYDWLTAEDLHVCVMFATRTPGDTVFPKPLPAS